MKSTSLHTEEGSISALEGERSIATPITSHVGLTSSEVARRVAQFGPNEIVRGQATPLWVLVLAQFRSPLVLLLLGATVVSASLGELADAIAISAIVLINGLVGFFQEHRAERAIMALRSMTAPRARVIRDGRLQVIPAAAIVPGDLLALEAGDLVAADAKLLEAHALSTIEAALTGESAPAEKSHHPSAVDAPLAERHDRVFLGTSVAAGTGLAEVTGIGMQTELGRIAHLLTTVDDEATPLQKKLERVGQTLLYACLAIVAVVAALGVVRGLSWLELLLSAVSLAVAAVPEGLPAVVTIALAVGVQRMAARRALVRRLLAVEALGSATVICTDKTGTLTTGIMTVRELWGADQTRLLDAAAACTDAEIGNDQRTGVGDPTEIAILMFAAERGIQRSDIEAQRPRVHVNPFDSDRKRMSVLRADGSLYVKGAVESVLQRCRATPDGVQEANAEMAARGLRVLAVAIGSSAAENDLEFLGLIGIADPPRAEAIEAIAQARAAGIRTIMITGDHPITARAIARELGLIGEGESADGRVHARATPEDKLDIVRHWKSQGHVVAMTGDGVNDAPALREAHIGIAMGRTGTEVTREASDIVLADDNFATIVAAIEEGRGIFDNIRKTLVYLLAGNAGELTVMLVAALIGLPMPLLPLHLLWINLVTDGLPALALVIDPSRKNIMSRPPRPAGEAILTGIEWRYIAVTGLLQAMVTLSVFVWALQARDLEEARNLAFTVLVFGELFRAFAARDPDRPFWELGVFSNLPLFGVVVSSSLVQIGIHHIPAAQSLLRIGTLSTADCLLSIVIGMIPLGVLEGMKLVKRARRSGMGNPTGIAVR